MAEKNVRVRRAPCHECSYGVMIRMKKVNGDEAWRCLNCGHVEHELPTHLRMQTPPKGIDK